jgi:hypothetical protein
VPRGWIVALILICTALNGAGFLWHLFEPIPGYDEIAHFITPFALVAITAEIIYRGGGDDEFFNTPRHAVITGSVIGLVGAAAWEGIETVLGILGGAGGAWAADRYLGRLFNRSRTNARRARVC